MPRDCGQVESLDKGLVFWRYVVYRSKAVILQPVTSLILRYIRSDFLNKRAGTNKSNHRNETEKVYHAMHDKVRYVPLIYQFIIVTVLTYRCIESTCNSAPTNYRSSMVLHYIYMWILSRPSACELIYFAPPMWTSISNDNNVFWWWLTSNFYSYLVGE